MREMLKVGLISADLQQLESNICSRRGEGQREAKTVSYHDSGSRGPFDCIISVYRHIVISKSHVRPYTIASVVQRPRASPCMMYDSGSFCRCT